MSGDSVWFDMAFVIFPAIAQNRICYFSSNRMKVLTLLKRNPPLYDRLTEFMQINPAAYPNLERRRLNGDPDVAKYIAQLNIQAS